MYVQRDPAYKKVGFKKVRHCFSEKVSPYKKVFGLKKSLSYNFLVYGSLHYDEPWAGLVHVCLLNEYEVMDIKAILTMKKGHFGHC